MGGSVRVQKKLNVLGVVEKKSGVSQKTGKPYVIYTVHADDEAGNRITEELTSFEELPNGLGEYWVEKRESQYGVQYTVFTYPSKPNPEREAQAKRAELERLLNDPLVRMDAHRVWQLLAELRDMAELSALAG
jgi:hypothetical protein